MSDVQIVTAVEPANETWHVGIKYGESELFYTSPFTVEAPDRARAKVLAQLEFEQRKRVDTPFYRNWERGGFKMFTALEYSLLRRLHDARQFADDVESVVHEALDRIRKA